MEIKEKTSLYIPYGVKAETEYIRGYGKRQLFQVCIGIACTVILSTMLYLIFRSMPTFALVLLVGISISILMTVKDDQTNQSIIDMLNSMVRFGKVQKHFEYKYVPEWHEDKILFKAEEVNTAEEVEENIVEI
jgi:MFS superfamily sulfate permease-like transporter